MKLNLRKRTPLEVATKELAESKLKRMEAQTGVEWAQSIVSYHDARIKRLLGVIKEEQAAAAAIEQAEKASV
jgi:hypothetical protein